jgi:hypothetical protein
MPRLTGPALATAVRQAGSTSSARTGLKPVSATPSTLVTLPELAADI